MKIQSVWYGEAINNFFCRLLKLSPLDKIRLRVKEILQTQKDSEQPPKPVDIFQRLLSIPKQLKRAKVWEDAKKRQKLEKLLNELEGLLL